MISIGTGAVVSATAETLTASGVHWKPGALRGYYFKPDVNSDLVYRILDNTDTELSIDPADGDLTLATYPGAQFSG
ncbi:MAG: hypothetical protein ACE5FF_12995, partial [Saprospiraceae bacterium]